MKNTFFLNLILFSVCACGWGCIATSSPIAQSTSPSSKPGTIVPVAKPVLPTSTTIPSASTSPFIPGVALPIFPGTYPIPSPTNPLTPGYPLVEVPTPGVQAVKGKNSSVVSPVNPTGKKRRVRRIPREAT